MFKTADARYAIDAMVSWPVYGGLYIAMLKVFESNYAAAFRNFVYTFLCHRPCVPKVWGVRRDESSSNASRNRKLRSRRRRFEC